MSRAATLAVEVRRASVAPTPEQVLRALPAGRRAVALESLHEVEPSGRYCIVSFDPRDTLPAASGDPFGELQARLCRWRAEPHPLPLAGGWIGYFGYECGRFLERLPGRAREDLDLPRAWWGLYDTVAVFDRRLGAWFVAGLDWPAGSADRRPRLAERLDEMERFLRDARERPGTGCEVAALDPPRLDHDTYLRDVRTIQRQIEAGEIYQANLTQRVGVPIRGPGRDLYGRLRQANPANYAAYLDGGDFEVLSSSPELFLEVHGEAVLTRPIKGTRPRVADPRLDAAGRRELLASEKDLAELAMIVDVERNDLGRVCSDITVTWPPRVESHPTVHHLVADVRGRLRADHTVVDLLRAGFPGGSVTGAPKIRAMEIIDALEPMARGPYCGCIGYIGLDGRATLSLAIRTMVVQEGTAYVHVGSGIVADSEPELEYQELLAKAGGMFAALNAPAPQPARS